MAKNTYSGVEYEAHILGMAFQCPIDEKGLTCPLDKVREMSKNQRFAWISSLTLKEKQDFYDFHIRCFLENK